MSVIDLGHWFPSRGNDSYPTYESVAGTEPTDTWNGIGGTANEMAQFQWLAKELELAISGTTVDSFVFSDTISVNIGRSLLTSYTDLYDLFVASEIDYRVTSSIENQTITVDGIDTGLYFSLGSIWIVGTEGDPDIETVVYPLCQRANWTNFIIPASFQLGSSGGDTLNPNLDDPIEPAIGRFTLSTPGAPVGHNFSMGFNIQRFRSIQIVNWDSLDVTCTVTSWLTLPAV